MKKIILFSIIFLLAIHNIIAQGTKAAETTNSNKYLEAMEKNIKSLDTVSSVGSFHRLANNFERIAITEKNKWEPLYYAAYCYAVMALMSDKASIDMLADKADSYLKQAIALSDNSETSVLAAMIHACRIMVDPISRFQINGLESAALLEKAKIQNPANPRPYFLQAKTQLKIPESMGGGKKIAKSTLESAIEKFKAFIPANSIAPNWGYQHARASLEQINKEQ